MKTTQGIMPMPKRAALLCLWHIMTEVSAFASSSQHRIIPSTSAMTKPLVFGNNKSVHSTAYRTISQLRHHTGQHKQAGTTTQLYLSIPRGGASSVFAATSAKLSQWTSTPSGTFNVALAVLAASTAVLKVCSSAGSNGANGETVVSTLPLLPC